MSDYIGEAQHVDIILRVGQTIDPAFNYYENDVLTDLTGQQLDCQVKDTSGNLIKNWSTAGTSPAITISTTSFSINDLIPFTAIAKYHYDIKKTNGTEIKFIRYGNLIVLKSITGATSAPIILVSNNYRIVQVGVSCVLQYTSDGINWSTVQTMFTPV